MMVWLVRQVGWPRKNYDVPYYVQQVDLPIPPFPGLFIGTEDDGLKDKVASVEINKNGAVLCMLEGIWYTKNDFDEDGWRDQLVYHTCRWQKIEHFVGLHKLPATGGTE